MSVPVRGATTRRRSTQYRRRRSFQFVLRCLRRSHPNTCPTRSGRVLERGVRFISTASGANCPNATATSRATGSARSGTPRGTAWNGPGCSSSSKAPATRASGCYRPPSTSTDVPANEGWDPAAGGFLYTTDPRGRPVVRDRFHWVLAEAIGAAAALAARTGDPSYEHDQARYWAYAAQHLLDQTGGNWCHELGPDNLPSSSTWPGKPDVYHALQATLCLASAGVQTWVQGWLGGITRAASATTSPWSTRARAPWEPTAAVRIESAALSHNGNLLRKNGGTLDSRTAARSGRVPVDPPGAVSGNRPSYGALQRDAVPAPTSLGRQSARVTMGGNCTSSLQRALEERFYCGRTADRISTGDRQGPMTLSTFAQVRTHIR